MGSNPQILYTPQQQMGYGGFSVPCRVGNWAEDEYLGVLNTQHHLQKSSEGMLTSQQLQGTLGAALAPVALAPAPADGAVKYGDVVMLSAGPDLGGVVAIDTTARLDLHQEAYGLTRTSKPDLAVACTRTAWTITPAPGTEAPADGVLRIGTPFCLAASGGPVGTVYLQSSRYTLHNQNYTKGPGSGCCVVPAMSADTKWTVKVLNPTDLVQMESEGQPVPANTFISLVHVNTQTPLHTDAKVVPNKYGGEYVVACSVDQSPVKGSFGKRNGKVLHEGNHFAFTTAEVA